MTTTPNVPPEDHELIDLLQAQMAANRLRLRKMQLRRQAAESQRNDNG